ncbi:MAG TPA: Rrf2 family transcriptional regulator [Acidobacteriota bacterium]|jgi:Rrf2 family protein
MKITAKSDYAILALFHLALDTANRPVQSRDISLAQRIPHRFLEQILLALKKAGLVKSVRGAKGGYQLAVSPSEISLRDAIEAVEGSIHLLGNREEDEIDEIIDNDRKFVKGIWTEIERHFIQDLASISLEDLKNRQQQQRDVLMYHI